MKLFIKNPSLLSALAAGICLTLTGQAVAQTFKILHTFPQQNTALDNTDGAEIDGGLVLSGTTLYGTAFSGGPTSNGTVFAVGTSGAASSFKLLHTFSGYDNTPTDESNTNSDGAAPMANMILSGSTLYGTASQGGPRGGGTVFSVNTDGSGFTTLYGFSGEDNGGENPLGGLVLANGTLYGTAWLGGVGGGGTVFAVNTNGTGFRVVYSFSGGTNDGAVPSGGLILSGGTLYGTTAEGGSGSAGTVFAVNTDGSGFRIVYNFSAVDDNDFNTDGASPMAALVLAGNTLYGTTSLGGPSGNGTVFGVNTDGSGFTALHSFSAYSADGTNSDGAAPDSTLVLSGSTLYGTADDGGLFNGTIFSVNTDGTGFKALYVFPQSGVDGYTPYAGVILSGNTLYGTAGRGGGLGTDDGTVFSLSLGAGGQTPPPGSVAITALTSPAHIGDVIGAGSYPAGTTVTLSSAVTNNTGCYQLAKWTVNGRTVGTNADYTFVVTGKETVVANFSAFEDKIETASSPAQGGVTTGGGNKACGSLVTVTARAGAGFKFTNWVANAMVQSEKPTFTFTADGDATLTANFIDIAPPKVTITSPVSGLKTTAGSITLSGKAQDNVAVTAVYYQDNATGGWTQAQETGNGWSTWSAQVSLSPGANVIDVYAVDSSQNSNAPASVKVTYEAPPGPAPASLAGYLATVTQGGTMEVSFGTSTFAQVPLDTNDVGRVGNYTYTQINLNTAELVLTDIDTPAKAGSSNTVNLTFSKAAAGPLTAVFTNADGSVGIVTLSQPSGFEPASLSGTTLQINQQNGAVFTNIFADGTFISTDNLGNSAGTYNYTPFSPVAGLIEEVFTTPSSLAGATNFIVVGFSQATAGNFYLESYVDGPGVPPSEAIGTFTVLGTVTPEHEIAPASVNGLTATIKPTGGKTYTSSYGLATFGTTGFANTNHFIGVANYTYTRLGTNTAMLETDYISPPQVAGEVEGPVLLTFTSPESADFTSGQFTGTISFAPAQTTAPQSLAGKTFSATLSNGKKGSLSFGDGTFTGVTTTGNSPKSSGTYTFAVYGPSVGVAQLSYTDAADAGLGESLQLAFTTATSGTFYTTQIESGVARTETGTFTSVETPQ